MLKMCLYPKLIENPKYKANKKNKGNIPNCKDERVKLVPIGCGNCMECLKKKAREWKVRLNEEIKNSKNGIFITFTFSDESIKELGKDCKLDGYERDNFIAKKGVRRFLERWRKKYKKSVKHWLITELGHNGTENVHLHGIIWTNESENTIAELWKYGYIWTNLRKGGFVNEKTINYITKYCTKRDEKHPNYKAKILTSQGIGKKYIGSYNSKKNKFDDKNTIEYYQTNKGNKLALPIYYRNKIYTDEEREKLWLNKLDEKVRYVDGTKIDISEGDEKYYKKLEIARQKNNELGYGNDEKNWDLIRYERELRNLRYWERIKRTKAVIKDPKKESEKVILSDLKDAF